MAWLKHVAISIVVSFLARESFIKNQPLSPPKLFFKKVIIVQPWFFKWWSLVLVRCLLPIYYIMSPVSMWGVYIYVNFPVNVAAFPYPACVQERMPPNMVFDWSCKSRPIEGGSNIKKETKGLLGTDRERNVTIEKKDLLLMLLREQCPAHSWGSDKELSETETETDQALFSW